MCVIRISNLAFPADMTSLREIVVKTVLDITELGFTKEKQVTVILIEAANAKMNFPQEVMVEIFGLFEKPERTPVVRNLLAKNVGMVVKEFFKRATVECFIHPPFNPAEGFWSSDS